MKKHFAFLCMTSLAAATGCSPTLERVEVTADTQPPLSSDISSESISLTEGTAVAITVRAFADGEAQTGAMSVIPTPSALEVLERGAQDDLDETSQYLLIGIAPANGLLSVTVTGTTGSVDIPFSVIAQ